MRTALFGCCVAAIAIAVSACDRETTPGMGLSTAPSEPPAITASIDSVTTAHATAFGFGCNTLLSPAAFNVVIVSPMSVRVDNVTIAMVNGQNLGGPMVTFPQPALTAQFGTTVVVAGVPRVFTFTPQFSCVPFAPSQVMAKIALVDSAGLPRTVTASGPFP